MWTDNETSEDLLGFQVHADLIKSLILEGNLLPITIGVFADWGGGKTSIMKIIQNSFDSESLESPEAKAQVDGILCLYFNGWLFEGYDDAKSALISSVIMSLGDHKRFGPKIKDKCASLLRSVNWLRVAYLGAKNVAIPAIAAYATGGATIVPQAANWFGWGAGQVAKLAEQSPSDTNNWETLIKNDPNPQNPLDIKDFREQFSDMLAKSDIKTLVVLIDDLDRCSPERIIENLEAIKLFLNVEGTAFLIGADPRIVRHAVEWKYGVTSTQKNSKDGDESQRDYSLVEDYLEKLIQYPYHLPKLSPAEIETYISLLFCKFHLSSDDFKKVLIECNRTRAANRFEAFGGDSIEQILPNLSGTQDRQKLRESLAISSVIAPLITECLKGNPRQVKRFLNLFELRKKLSEVAHLNHIKNNVLVKMMILEYCYPERYEELYRWQNQNEGKPQILIDLENHFNPQIPAPDVTSKDDDHTDVVSEKSSKTEKPSKSEPVLPKKEFVVPAGWEDAGIRKWIQVNPALSGIDLRDYFWLTRDRLQSTLAGMTMISPVVRRLIERLLRKEKDDALFAEISGMSQEDQKTLCMTLRKEIYAAPSKSDIYKIFQSLIEKGIHSAQEEYTIVFKNVSPEKIPAAVGGTVAALCRSYPSLKEVAAIFEASPNTKAGKAYANIAKGN